MTRKILVIDDEPAIRKSFVLALEDSKYEITTAENGEQGVEKIREQNYDLIFLDLKMPGMNGIDALREIRKKDKEVPVYIVTAFHKEFFEDLKRMWQEGIEFELLEKPISQEQIRMIVRGILDGTVSL